MARSILIIEDEARIAGLLRRGLVFEGFRVETCSTAEEGLRSLRVTEPDLVILDIMLPDVDGFEVCRRLREVSRVPILMLTARDTVGDRVKGLDLGADDYLVKPFDFDELLARVRALLRRADPPAADRVAFADLELNATTREVRRGGRSLDLTPTEFELLAFLLRHPRRVLTQQQILEAVWGFDFEGDTNVLQVYVGYLRRKTEAGGEPRLIHTVRGVGYALREPR